MNKEIFNIRVYAIILNDKDEVLLSDERRNGFSFTKFPGGGLEWGEGITDCLVREMKEELDLDVTLGELFYVNDFFQLSRFHTDNQLIGFYYYVDEIDHEAIPATEHTYPLTEETEKFRWVKRSELIIEELTFPVDRIVAEKLKA